MGKIISALFICVLFLSSLAEAQQVSETDEATGIQSWEIEVNDVHFSLTQILPEQLQAFYVNRGFSLEQIQPYVTSCVYMAVLRNDRMSGAVHFISNNWQIFVEGKPRSLTTVDKWVQQLTTKRTKKSALVAFRWAQFPHEHEYEAGGDWNQGMLSMGLPKGTTFNIVARWDINGDIHDSTLQGVQCAK